MQYVLKPNNRGLKDEELLEDLRRVAQALGKKTVSSTEYPHHGRCNSRVFEVRFGSWNGGLKAAGLEISLRRNISNQELFENLERVWQALGRQPLRNEVKKPLSDFAAQTYERRFCGWRRALEAFVAYANGPRDSAAANSLGPVVSKQPGRSPSAGLRFAVFKRDSFKCQACGRSAATDPGTRLHVDHKIPWSLGGQTTLENLTTLCDRCNLGKADGEGGVQSRQATARPGHGHGPCRGRLPCQGEKPSGHGTPQARPRSVPWQAAVPGWKLPFDVAQGRPTERGV